MQRSTHSEEDFLSCQFPTKKLTPIEYSAPPPQELEYWQRWQVPSLVSVFLVTLVLLPAASTLVIRWGVDNPLAAKRLVEADRRALGFDDDIGHEVKLGKSKNWTYIDETGGQAIILDLMVTPSTRTEARLLTSTWTSAPQSTPAFHKIIIEDAPTAERAMFHSSRTLESSTTSMPRVGRYYRRKTTAPRGERKKKKKRRRRRHRTTAAEQ